METVITIDENGDTEKSRIAEENSRIGEKSRTSEEKSRIDEKSRTSEEKSRIGEKSRTGEEKSRIGEEGGNSDEGKVKDLTVIDVKCEGKLDTEGEYQRVCRICHLSTFESGKNLVDLIELGCGCKGELGFVHSHCAEAWFKLKGNRFCEICGDVAQNITGVSDNRFMEEWNDARSTASGISSTENRGCWRGQPFCNFLMACLVISFVLPWFFRVNMF